MRTPILQHPSRPHGQPSRAALAAELARLDPACLLVERGPFTVYCARSEEVPLALRELGRLRGEVFPEARRAGRLDLDRFDGSYRHLFLWNRAAREIAGAYRLAGSDEVGELRGGPDLYTRTLFDIDRRLFEEVHPALELGRSFVRPSYQRSFAPLHLLWQGIGAWIARHPRYRWLFGALTIHHGFRSDSRDLLLDLLEAHPVPAPWRELVRALHPVPGREPSSARPLDARAVRRRVSELERGARRMPVLVRHYLRLGARTFDSSVDAGFGGSVDVLVLVDLLAAPEDVLRRYLGRAGLAGLRERHGALVARARATA